MLSVGSSSYKATSAPLFVVTKKYSSLIGFISIHPAFIRGISISTTSCLGRFDVLAKKVEVQGVLAIYPNNIFSIGPQGLAFAKLKRCMPYPKGTITYVVSDMILCPFLILILFYVFEFSRVNLL